MSKPQLSDQMIEEAGRIFSALSDPSRLKLLRLLMASPELPSQEGARGDLEAAGLQAEAAREGLNAQRGLLKPEVGLTLTAGTARKNWSEGGNWTSTTVGAK